MDPDTVKEIACTLPLPVIEHLWRQPVADVARKTLTVDVVDLISELEQHTADRLLQKKWLTTIQAFAVAPTIAAATRSVSTPPPNSAKNVCGDDTKSSPASPSKGTPLHTQGGAFGIAAAALNPLAMTIRRADVEAVLLEASSTSQDGKVYLASSATREEGNDEASAAVKRQLLASPAAAPARINDDDVPDVDDDDGGNSPPSIGRCCPFPWRCHELEPYLLPTRGVCCHEQPALPSEPHAAHAGSIPSDRGPVARLQCLVSLREG